jgi:hypothetical protein
MVYTFLGFEISTFGALNSKPNQKFEVFPDSLSLDFQSIGDDVNERQIFTAVPTSSSNPPPNPKQNKSKTPKKSTPLAITSQCPLQHQQL